MTLTSFDVLPIPLVSKIFMLIIITISVVTQCESMTITLASMTMKETTVNEEAPVALKLFWGITFAVIAAVFIVLGGIDGVKTIKSFCGIPLAFICGWLTLALSATWPNAPGIWTVPTSTKTNASTIRITGNPWHPAAPTSG